MKHELNLPGLLGSQPGQQGSLQGGLVFSGKGKLNPVCGMENHCPPFQKVSKRGV